MVLVVASVLGTAWVGAVAYCISPIIDKINWQLSS
jgi:hypothetical protein